MHFGLSGLGFSGLSGLGFFWFEMPFGILSYCKYLRALVVGREI